VTALRLCGLLLLCLAAPAAAGEAPSWQIEAGSKVGFTAYQAGAPVEGVFGRFAAELRFDAAELGLSRVEVAIEMASVDSRSKDRDDTIRSAALFDVATWPTARFETTRFSAAGDGAFRAEGKLTLRDVTRAVVLPFRLAVADHPDQPAAWRARATGELTVKRLDYGIGQGLWQDTSVVGDEVVITIDILAKRAKE
jgi:polyisoprenoid-binding protein YceI